MQQQSLNVAAWRLSKPSLLPAAAGASGAASEAKKEFWGGAPRFRRALRFADLGAMEKHRRQNGELS